MDENMIQMDNRSYLLECQTDVGTKRISNQDACCARMVCWEKQTIVMAIVCDGVGGMSDGEYASRSTVQFFNNWFDYWLVDRLKEQSGDTLIDLVTQELDKAIHEQNYILYEYGRNNGIKLGTTLTLMLFMGQQYLIAQVGDSRAYCVKHKLVQLTDDQSLVEREVREGKLSPKQAVEDPRRNIILQCVGGQESILPVYRRGEIENMTIYFLCSDGFIHKLKEKELEEIMSPRTLSDRNAIRKAMLDGIERVKQRGEKDNITVVVVRTDSGRLEEAIDKN